MIGQEMFLEYSVEVIIDESILTKEMMDGYERYIKDINEDSDFDSYDTQIQKHIANICHHLVRGNDVFIEGYGDVRKIVKFNDIRLSGITEG